MPLFIDFHKEVPATMEELVSAHLADLAIQDKYGVKYHKYWMNPAAGTIYCLIEGPDKHSCEAVHRASHGILACAMVEVDPAFFKIFMGDGYSIGDGPVLNQNGTIDLGYRHILNLLSLSRVGSANRLAETDGLINEIISQHSGRKVDGLLGTTAVFDSADKALHCAQAIQSRLLPDQEIWFKMGLNTGQPLTEHDQFFGEAIRRAAWFCTLAKPGQVIVSSLTKRLCQDGIHSVLRLEDAVKVLNEGEEEFISSWFSITDPALSDEDFNLEKLTKQIGISRPQLYRKVFAIAGRSPNDLLRDQRMEKAAGLLKKKQFNISQVAFEVGYSSPSYFSRSFTEKFGCLPSKFDSVAD